MREGLSEFTCARCGCDSGMGGHLRSDGTWGCQSPPLPWWVDDLDSLFDSLDWYEPVEELSLDQAVVVRPLTVTIPPR